MTAQTDEVKPSENTVELPLAGRTVMITRAREQAAEFASALEAYGARVVSCPTIEIAPPESYAALDDAIENLFGYDWLIFTSANAVEHFCRRLEASGKDASELDELRVCAVRDATGGRLARERRVAAVGDGTADRLADERVHVDLVPQKFQAEGVFEALENFLGGRERIAGLTFLLPRPAAPRGPPPRA